MTNNSSLTATASAVAIYASTLAAEPCYNRTITVSDNPSMTSGVGSGIVISNSVGSNTGVVIRNNQITGNASSAGIRLLGSGVESNHTNIQIVKNSVVGGNSGVYVFESKPGSGNVISENTLTQAQGSSVRLAASGFAVAQNTLTGNSGSGVDITSGSGNRISQNSISDNGKIGINLGADGVTANDPGDVDTGPNNLQNYPVLTRVMSYPSSLTIQGTLNSTPNTAFTLEFFASPAGSSRQGKTYLGTCPTTTDSAGNAHFTCPLPKTVAPGDVVNATATDPAGNTSEFSDSGPIVSDTTPPTIAITAPGNGATYLLNQAVPANYKCEDAESGIVTCSGPVPSGGNIDTARVGPHAFTVTAKDVVGNQSSATRSYTVIPLATLQVYGALHTVGSGTNPGSTKTPLPLSLKVFDKVKIGSPDPKDYGTIYGSPAEVVSPVVISGPIVTTVGGGQANLYTVRVPASDPAYSSVASGSYLVIGKATIGGVDVYVGSPTDPLPSGSVTQKYLQIIKNANDKLVPATTTAVPGSTLLIAEPAYLEFTSDTELLPFVYESVDGVWSAIVKADAPEGFVSNPGALSVDVSTSQLKAVQFTVKDVGSSWTTTKVTHQLKHNGNDKTVTVNIGMLNRKPNPAAPKAPPPNPTKSPSPAGTPTHLPIPRP